MLTTAAKRRSLGCGQSHSAGDPRASFGATRQQPDAPRQRGPRRVRATAAGPNDREGAGVLVSAAGDRQYRVQRIAGDRGAVTAVDQGRLDVPGFDLGTVDSAEAVC